LSSLYDQKVRAGGSRAAQGARSKRPSNKKSRSRKAHFKYLYMTHVDDLLGHIMRGKNKYIWKAFLIYTLDEYLLDFE